jgi:transposase
MLDFSRFFCYDYCMKNTKILATKKDKDNIILEQKNRIEELETLVKYYEEQLLMYKRKKYLSASEKSRYDELQLLLEGFDAPEVAEELKDEVIETSVNGHKRQKRLKKDSLPENTPVEKVVHELPEEEKNCPDCKNEMHIMGRTYRDEWVIIPAQVKIRRHEIPTYTCRKCEKSAGDTPPPIIKAKMPPLVLKGSYASPEAIAYAAYQKFVMGVPLYRQEQDWKRQGVFLSRQTLSNWLIEATEFWVKPIFDELKRRLLLSNVLHIDETTFQVLKEPGKKPQSKSYLWVYRTGSDASEPIVIAEYIPDRKHINPKNFLKGYSGYIHADGYEAYHSLPDDIVVVGCWAHVRRKFNDALKAIKEKDRPGTDAMIGKRFCDELFRVERELSALDVNERYIERREKLKPVMDEFYDWASKVRTLEKLALGKAITYMFSQREYLENVLLDGRLELSNNRAERTIKPFVICRKNFLFANTPRGAAAAAAMFSLIETARETGVNPLDYLTYVLQIAPALDMADARSLALLSPHGYKNVLQETSH